MMSLSFLPVTSTYDIGTVNIVDLDCPGLHHNPRIFILVGNKKKI